MNEMEMDEHRKKILLENHLSRIRNTNTNLSKIHDTELNPPADDSTTHHNHPHQRHEYHYYDTDASDATTKTERTYQEIGYLKKTFGPILVAAMSEICMRQPSDPIDYLGHWLLRYKYNEESKRQDVENEMEVVKEKELAKSQGRVRSGSTDVAPESPFGPEGQDRGKPFLGEGDGDHLKGIFGRFTEEAGEFDEAEKEEYFRNVQQSHKAEVHTEEEEKEEEEAEEDIEEGFETEDEDEVETEIDTAAAVPIETVS